MRPLKQLWTRYTVYRGNSKIKLKRENGHEVQRYMNSHIAGFGNYIIKETKTYQETAS